MKRFEFPRFSPLEVSRRVQQCLRFEGVNTNGVAAANGIGVAADRETMAEETLLPNPDASNKINILSTIRKKLKKSKRNKGRPRSDSLTNVCQCNSENCELHSCCPKHYLGRKHKQGDKSSVWPIASSILRSQNHQQPDNKTDDVAELIQEDSEPCSCYPYSMSNVSCDVAPNLSDTEIDILDTAATEDAAMQISPYATSLCAAGLSSVIEACVPRVGNLTQELYKLSKYGWYWGPINRGEAEEKLVSQPDGSFLVRDSSDDRYILSLSFRSFGKTLHTRIEHSNGLFSFYSQPEPEGHASIVELIQESMCYSQSGVFCYSRSRSPGSPSFPVRLTKPISRFTQVRSLQYLCRFVIRQYTRYDHIQKLPLPLRIKGYLEEGHY